VKKLSLIVTIFFITTSLIKAELFNITADTFANNIIKEFNSCGLSHEISLINCKTNSCVLKLDDYAKFTISFDGGSRKVDIVTLDYTGKLDKMIPSARIANQIVPFIASLSQKSCKKLNDKPLYLFFSLMDEVKATYKERVSYKELRQSGVLVTLNKQGDFSYSVSFIKEEK